MNQFIRVGNGDEEGDDEGEFSRLLDEYQQAMEQGTVSTFWNGRICSADARDRITQIGSTVGEVELYFADAQLKPPLDSELYFVGKGLPGFEIERELGRGSNGIVYLAFDTHLNRHVAVKFPRVTSLGSASARKRFRQEAQLAACIDHPHVLPIFEIGMRRDADKSDATNPDVDHRDTDHRDIDYIVSAYCPGPNLSHWLKTNAQLLTAKQSAELVLRLAEGLDACHSQNILHRDIKPANVMLFPVECGTLPFWPKLTDFGLAKALDFDLELTASNEWVGTPRYMAAEQISDARGEIGTATDVYSLGAVLYELIAGRPPFDANELPTLFDQIRASRPILPRSIRPHLPEALEAICLKCLQKSVANRYATARELADDLVRFLAGKPTLAKQAGTKRVATILRSFAASVLIALSFFAGLSLWSSMFTREQPKQSSTPASVSSPNQIDAFEFSKEKNTVFLAPFQYSDSQPLTIETWIRPTYPRGMILNFGGFLSLFSDDGRAWVGPSITLTLAKEPMLFLHAATTLPPNEWVHLACVYDGNTIEMYINGSRADLQVFTEDFSGVRGSANLSEFEPIKFDGADSQRKLSIGGNFPGAQEKYSYPFSGSIRNLRISRIARYSAPFRPDPELKVDSDTALLYRFVATITSVQDQANRSAPALAEQQRSP